MFEKTVPAIHVSLLFSFITFKIYLLVNYILSLILFFQLQSTETGKTASWLAPHPISFLNRYRGGLQPRWRAQLSIRGSKQSKCTPPYILPDPSYEGLQ